MDISKLVRPNILRLSPYQSARDKVQSGVLLDANENPYPQQWQGAQVNRYPDPRQQVLRKALAQSLGVQSENVLAGVGSDEILDWVFKVFCQSGTDRVAVADPTYGMYRVLAEIWGVDCQSFRLGPGFQLEADRFLDEVEEEVKVLFLCSPNNPTGNLLDRRAILRICRDWGKVVVVDEAYLEFSGVPSLAGELSQAPNLIVVRTLSKAYGRAGLRLGYAVASSRIISYLMKVKPPYNLSAGAMEAGCRAVQESSGLEFLEGILQQRDRVAVELAQVPGVEEVFPSQANFLLFRCRRGREVCGRLLERGIVVRDRGGLPGLENCIRVTIGTPSENDLFLGELRGLMETRR